MKLLHVDLNASKPLGSNKIVSSSIIGHTFFQYINWNVLQREEMEPEWVPNVFDDADAKCIDSEMLNQLPVGMPEWGPCSIGSVSTSRIYSSTKPNANISASQRVVPWVSLVASNMAKTRRLPWMNVATKQFKFLARSCAASSLAYQEGTAAHVSAFAISAL